MSRGVFPDTDKFEVIKMNKAPFEKKTNDLKKSGAGFLIAAFCFQMFAFTANAQTFRKESSEMESAETQIVSINKIAPDLEEKTNDLFLGLRAEENQKVIIQLKSDTLINELTGNNLTETDRNQMLAQEVGNTKKRTGNLLTELSAMRGRLKKSFNNLGLISAELPLSKIRELAQNENVAYISPDSDIQSFGHIAATTGWENPTIYDFGDADPETWLNGGMGSIAVIDSGIDANHSLMQYSGVYGTKVAFNKDFTGQNITGDPFGHGSHVASLLAGDWTVHDGAYEAPAEGANILNLRVLNSTGQGAVSNLIAALDWTVANKTAWNIRVINMSLGTAARDSYKNDPLCIAARRAVNAGIVVVASAGNYGKDLFGNKLYGTIGSPGIEPSVITVGAANTLGTDGRSDDSVASFSSRGPTRGYVTLANGARKYDNLMKPDLIAPGNKLIGARGYYNGTENFLARTFTTLRAGNDTLTTDKLMYLSGTSMSAPIVAGAAALLIQTNPNLTPNLVKAILMYSAQPLRNFNSLEQGAGELNIDGAIRIARLIKPTMPTTNGAALLTGVLPTSQTSVICGQTVTWGKSIITNHGFLYGNDLMNKWQGMYANGVLASDGTPFSGTAITKSTALTSGTLNLYQGAIKNNGVLASDGTLYLSANAMGGSPTPTVNNIGILVSDGVLASDGILASDGVLASDGNAYSTQALLGDNTTSMLPAP
jgi:serine protease AprX